MCLLHTKFLFGRLFDCFSYCSKYIVFVSVYRVKVTRSNCRFFSRIGSPVAASGGDVAKATFPCLA